MARGVPDYYSSIALHGEYDKALKPVQVDSEGQLYAMLRALAGEEIQDLFCDDNGILYLNVKAQDLAQVINRPKYGGAVFGHYYDNIPVNVETPLISFTGKGVIYGGYIVTVGADVQKSDRLLLYVDGAEISKQRYNELISWSWNNPGIRIFYLTDYDQIGYRYGAAITGGITFETSIKVSYDEEYGRTPLVEAGLVYATV